MERAPSEAMKARRLDQPGNDRIGRNRHLCAGQVGLGLAQRGVERLQASLPGLGRIGSFVGDVIGMAGEPVDREDCRTQRPRQQPRAHREILGVIDPMPGTAGCSRQTGSSLCDRIHRVIVEGSQNEFDKRKSQWKN